MSNVDANRRRGMALGTKVTLCVALSQIPLLALVAIFQIREARQDYLQPVEWRSQALAQSLQKRTADLSGYAPEMQRTLGLSVECDDLLQDNIEGGLVHVGVIGLDGKTIAHTNTDMINQAHQIDAIDDLLAGSKVMTALGPEAYHTFIPVMHASKTEPVAVIDIGFSRRVIDEKARGTITYAVTLFLAFLLLSFLLISGLLMRFVTHPVALLSRAAVELAQGHQSKDLEIDRTDEIGLLAISFVQMRSAIQRQISDLTREINDRTNAESQLAKSESNLRVTLDSIGDAVIATDIQGLITRMNPVAQKLTGYTHAQAVGKPLEHVFQIINSLTRDPVDNPCKKVLSTDEIVGLANHTVLIAKDGTERQIADSGAPIKGDQGEVVGVVLVFRDVTEEYALQERLRQAQEDLLKHQRRETEIAEAKLAELSQQLVHQTRLATIGQMTASIAHEIRNPLGAVRNAAYLIERKFPAEATHLLKYLRIIDQEVNSVDVVISDMLEMARSKEPVRESVDLSALVREVFDRMNDKDRRLELVSNPEPFLLDADLGQLRQVTSNLVTNAIQATGDNGVVTVELQRNATESSITVRDNGCGIAAEDRDRVFEPLFTTKAKGTGLGLCICRQIVERHGGTIELQDQEDSSTQFCVRLPH